MKSLNKLNTLVLVIIGLVFSVTANVSAQQSIDGAHDISLLMKEADVGLDMASEDAVFLFDSERIRLNKDGRYTKYIHRIIWINTDIAIRHYGDVRVPYDAARCSFNMETVRTWRDNQWWETGPDGIVETLPDGLLNAYDYANMREMMLLHEGIELPCILEIAYSIEDKEPFRRGWDGSWTFVRDEPVIKSWFGFELPSGWWPNIYEFPGSPAPIKSTDESLGLDMYSWQRGPYDAKTFPPPENIEDNESFVLWSTWKDWSSLGAHIRTYFDKAAVGDKNLKEQLDSLLDGANTDREKTRLIAGYVNDKTTYIDYPWRYWLSDPRPAVKTYSSTYGHALDRAVLAAALFSKANIKTLPVFLNPGFGNINVDVAELTQLSTLGLWLSGENLAAYYDPITSEIKSGPLSFFSRMAWRAGNDEKPNIRINGLDKTSTNNIRIELSYDADKKNFTGSGYFSATNYFNQYLQIAGMKNEAFTYFEELVSSIFKNAKLTGCNPSEFTDLKTIYGFQFELDSLTIDKQDRIELILGESAYGILANLPINTELYHNQRTSPMHFPCLMSQNIELTLDLKGLDLIHYPEDNSIENEAGNFIVHSAKTDKNDKKSLTVVRSLILTKTDYTAEEWLPLRTLLLADRNDGNRLILVKAN